MEIRPDMIKFGKKINGQCTISVNITSIRLKKCTEISPENLSLRHYLYLYLHAVEHRGSKVSQTKVVNSEQTVETTSLITPAAIIE